MVTHPDPDVASRAATYAASFRLEDAPPRVLDRARLVLLDTVGVCIRGASTPHVADAAGLGAGLCDGEPVGGPGGTVFATRERRPPAAAALSNAAGGTSLELDEGNQRSAHPGVHTVPPALAVAEHVGASGEELLGAVVAGYEVGARLGDVIRPLADGLHPHGGWAPVAGAVATGRLLGLDVDELANAVRIAVNPFVATHWKAALDGATVRDFYAGVCCAHGVRAADLAAAGVAGVDRAVADCLLPYTAGREVTDELLDSVVGTLGERYYLESSYVKVHAACRYAHAPIEALAALQAAHALDPDGVERVTVRTFELGTRLDDRSPHNVLAAKFSTPFALAARAVLGASGVDAFTPETVADERIQSLADRVEVLADPEFEARATDGEWGAEVVVELADGTTLAETVRDARGGGENPFTREEVLAKFDGLVGAVLSPADTGALRERLLAVEAVDDAATLLDPLRG